MHLARSHGALVSMDLNLRPSLWHAGTVVAPRVWEALAQADLVKLSRNEAEFLIGDNGDQDTMLQRLWYGHARCVLITDASQPVRWFTRHAQGEVPTFPVRVTDTTAATGPGSAISDPAAHGHGLVVHPHDVSNSGPCTTPDG